MRIDVRNLHVSYFKQTVLEDITFSAVEKDLICVLGPNGVGKSTLFRCMLRLIKKYTGDVLIAGKNTRALSVKELAQHIAYIPQSHDPTFNFSVLNVVLMGLTVHLKRNQGPNITHEKKAMKALEKLGIAHLSDRGFSEISGGERQLALIARAIVQEAKIMVMDEPTAHLDYGNQIRVMMEVKQLAKQGYIIILSTHNPEHAFLYSNKVLILHEGKILKFGEPKQVLTEKLLEDIFHVHVKLQDVQTDHGQVRMIVPNQDLTV